MSSANPENAMNRQIDLVKSIWKEIRALLEHERDRFYEEIRNYPPPIPACDEQFNYLLEERARISEELDRMHNASQKSLADGGSIKLIDEFLRSSSYIDDEAGHEIRRHLKEGLSAPGT